MLWAEAILMSTHNICFYTELTKIILELSSNTLLICATGPFTANLFNKSLVNLSAELVFRWSLSHITTKWTKWPVRPTKTRINLGFCPVGLIFAVCKKKPWVLSLPVHTTNSDWTGRIPRLNWVFAGRTGQFVGFVMLWLKFSASCQPMTK